MFLIFEKTLIMFSELSRKDILNAINSGIQKPIREGMDYSVLYNCYKYSSRELITWAFQHNGLNNPSPGFNTNQVQKGLLELGFPIVEIFTILNMTVKKGIL